MTKPCVLYPTGQGGHWLSNLIYSLETNQFDIVPTSNNFHHYQQSKKIFFRHVDNPYGNVIGSFCSVKSQFITYLNAYYKCFIAWPTIQNLNDAELLYTLSNDARWRMDIWSSWSQDYLTNVVLNADLLFTDPKKFAAQVFALLECFDIKHTPNIEFVLASVDNFKKSCWSLERIDITKNIVWLAWCHAMCLLNKIDVPFSVRDNFELACNWLVAEQTYFLNKTKQQFLTHA
jgi:hypothetical protein